MRYNNNNNNNNNNNTSEEKKVPANVVSDCVEDLTQWTADCVYDLNHYKKYCTDIPLRVARQHN